MASTNVGEPFGETHGEWTDQDILDAVDAAVCKAMAATGAEHQAVAFWTEWSIMEPHVPMSRRKAMICSLDQKLSSKGLPTLRELMSLDPFPRHGVSRVECAAAPTDENQPAET